MTKKLKIFGIILLLAGITIVVLTFFPVVREEIKYAALDISTPENQSFGSSSKIDLTPLDKEFSLLIPKIGANTKVIKNVDPYNSKIYQWELTKGVAHAKGSVLPDEKGNVFIFAHSAGNFFEANRFNAVFYLLSKLEKGDDILLYYKNQKYRYLVTEKTIVAADAVNYLTGNKSSQTLTLMTCWPPGTSWKRLIVAGELLN